MDYTNEVFANIAKEIADRKEYVITRAFTSQIAELLQKKRHYTDMQRKIHKS